MPPRAFRRERFKVMRFVTNGVVPRVGPHAVLYGDNNVVHDAYRGTIRGDNNTIVNATRSFIVGHGNTVISAVNCVLVGRRVRLLCCDDLDDALDGTIYLPEL